MSRRAADDFTTIRARRRELALESLAADLGRPVRATGMTMNHCDFCTTDLEKSCHLPCSEAQERWFKGKGL